MPWRICFHFPPPSRRKICIDIPILVRKFEIEPRPWIAAEFIDEKVAKDLSVLATIDSLASQLSNAAVKKAVQTAIQGGVDQKLLKEDAKIEFR
jgi:hypothetical protein